MRNALILACVWLMGAAAPITEVTSVHVDSDGASRTIRIATAGEPAFTVFRMSDPMRIVIDVARGSVAKLDSPIEINDGVVTAVATQQFSDGKTVLGRLVIAFEHTVDYEVKAVGNEIRVLARDNSPVPLASKGKKPVFVAKADPVAPQTTMAPDAKAKPVVAKAVAVKPTESKPAEAKPAEVKVADVKGTDAKLMAIKVVEPKVPAAPLPVQDIVSKVVVDKTLTRVSTDNRRDGATINLQIHGGTPAYEVLELEDPARVVIDLIGVRAKSTHHPVYNLGEVGRLRLGYHNDKVRLVLDSDSTLPSYEIRATRTGLAIVTAVRKPDAKAQATVASIEPPKAAPVATLAPVIVAKPVVAKVDPPKVEAPKPVVAKPAKEPTKLTVAAPAPVEKRQLGHYEFKREGDRGSLHIAAPAGTGFEVDSTIARAPVLIMRDIDLPNALETSVDTTSSLTAVSRVTAFNERPSAKNNGKKNVHIIANLRGDVTSRAYRDGDEIVWEFAALPVQAVVDSAVKPLPVVAGFSSQSTQLARSAATGQTDNRKFSIDSRGADLLNVLRLISEVSGENIVAGDDVGGKITLRLRNVPWEQALDAALKTKGFGRVKTGNIIRVAPLDKLQKEKEQELARIKTEEQVQPTFVRIISVNYAKATAIAEQVKQLLTKDRGKLSVDERTNSIIVEDLIDVLNKIEGLARRLDTQTPQVLIESRIVEANTSFVRDIGIQWGGATLNSPATGNATGLQFPNTIGVAGGASGTTPVTGGTANVPNYAVNLPSPVGAGAGGALGFIFGNASNTAQLSLRLSALENNGTIRIVSAPKVTMLDNTKAHISQGVDIPISVVSAAGTNTRFIPANLQLEVTPHVTQDGSVMMDIHVSNNQPDFSRTGAQGDPTIQKKEAETNVLVKDGDTTVIGGIYTRNSSVTYNEIPFLSKIPVLGWLFKHKHEEDSRAELLIFITPRIVNRQQMSVGAASL